MATDLLTQPNSTAGSTPNAGEEQSATKLVSGIVKDAQELLTQQITLLKDEAEEDLRLTTQAAITLGIGLATALVGAFLLCQMLVYGLDHLVPGYLWLWYGVVGAGVAVVGVAFISLSLQAFSKINPPLPETQEAIKETLEWQTKPR